MPSTKPKELTPVENAVSQITTRYTVPSDPAAPYNVKRHEITIEASGPVSPSRPAHSPSWNDANSKYEVEVSVTISVLAYLL